MRRCFSPTRMPGVEPAFQAIIGGAVAIFIQGLGVFRLDAVQFGAPPEHFADPENPGAVRIVRQLAFRMVLAVYGHPFLGDHAGSQPEPKTEKVAGHGVEFQGAVCLMAMQEDRDAGNRQVGQGQGN